jgi:hypothetical protein
MDQTDLANAALDVSAHQFPPRLGSVDRIDETTTVDAPPSTSAMHCQQFELTNGHPAVQLPRYRWRVRPEISVEKTVKVSSTVLLDRLNACPVGRTQRYPVPGVTDVLQ